MNVNASVATSIRQQGLHLSDEFIQASVAGGTSQDSERNVFEKSLHCDFNVCAVGCLPSDIESWDKKLLEGRVVLQVDELTDMAANAKQRYDDDRGCQRCLKLYMTDGKVHVCGFEQERIPELAPLMQAGFKVALQDVLLRRGIMVLTPKNVTVLGGHVDRLEEARQRVVERWRQPIACNAGGAGGPLSLYNEATAVAWPENVAIIAGAGENGIHVASAPSASIAQAAAQRAVQIQAAPQMQPSPQHAVHPTGSSGLAAACVSHAAAEAHGVRISGDALQSTNQYTSASAANPEQESLAGDYAQVSQDVGLPDQHDSAAGVNNNAVPDTLDAHDWSSDEPDQFCDAVEEHLPSEDEVEVVELSGDSDKGPDPLDTATQQHTPGIRMQASIQANVLSSESQSDQEATITSLSQLARAQGVVFPVEIFAFAAVTEMVSNLRFLDEHKHALQQYSMAVRIEERAGGDEYTASVHPTVLEEMLGMSPAEMHDCLAQGQNEMVRERVTKLKRFLSTFAGQMHLLVEERQSEPVICKFIGANDAGYEDTHQLMDVSSPFQEIKAQFDS